jgi:hypothetical protein
VVPAKNEERNLPHVLSAIPDDVLEVVLVDGWSTDRTVQVARSLRPGIRVVRQTRRGKGNALMCGFHACRGDIIVMLDADGSGTRFGLGGGSTDITRLRRTGNWALNHLVNLIHRTAFTDLCYGYNAFWSACLPLLEVCEAGEELAHDHDHGLHGLLGRGRADHKVEVRWGDGFEIETLLTVRAAALGFTIKEVGSFESCRIHGVSNLNAVRDGWRVLRTIHLEYQAARRQPRPALPAPWSGGRLRDRGLDLRDGDGVVDLRHHTGQAPKSTASDPQ